MRAVLDADSGLRTGRVICQVVLMEILRDGRRFLLSDMGICIQPSLEQKLDILRSAVGVAQRLGVAEPRVAVLASSESVTESMSETLDAAELQRRSQVRELPGCTVQGPLSLDLAYAAEAAEKKRIVGPVTGEADGFPSPGGASGRKAAARPQAPVFLRSVRGLVFPSLKRKGRDAFACGSGSDTHHRTKCTSGSRRNRNVPDICRATTVPIGTM